MPRFRHRLAIAWLIAVAITLQGLAAHAMVLPTGDADTSLEAALRVICTGHGVAGLPDGGQHRNARPDHDCSLCQCSPAVAKSPTQTTSERAFSWVRRAPSSPASERLDEPPATHAAAPRASPPSLP